MSTEPRIITLPTLDSGNVTLPEPTWCVGHDDHRPDTHRTDLSHDGAKVPLLLDGRPVGDLLISQAPCADPGPREPQGFVWIRYGEDYGRSPAQLYDLAAALDTHADQIRALADELAAILAGGGR